MIDGVIKYSQTSHIPRSIGEFSFYEELEGARGELFKASLIGVYPNGVGYGNISAREGANAEAGKRVFVITGSQTGALERLAISDYVRVLSYDLVALTMNSEGERSASSESLTHAAIYDANEDIKAVIHVHSASLWDFMLKNGYPKTDKNIEYGTKEMAKAVWELFLASNPAVFATEGHEEGVFAVGSSINEAMQSLKEVLKKLQFSQDI